MDKCDYKQDLALNTLLFFLIVVGAGFFIYFSLVFCVSLFNGKINFLNSFLISAIIGACLLYLDFILQKQRGLAEFNWAISLTIITIGLMNYNFIIILWCVGFVHLLYSAVFCSTTRMQTVKVFSLYLLIPLFTAVSIALLFLINDKTPLVLDEYLMAIDGTLGFFPSLFLRQLNQMLPESVNFVVSTIYLVLPLIVLIIFRILQSKEQKIPMAFLFEVSCIGIVGYSLYYIIPGCGTDFFLHSPIASRLQEQGPQLINCPSVIPRNSIPSLHMAWLICLIRGAFLCGRGTQIFMAIVFIANIIAMFGIGAHYLVDVIVGLLFANIFGGLFSLNIPLNNPSRWQPIIIGTSFVIGWYILILYGLSFLQISKLIAWAFFLGSVVISIWFEYRLIKGNRSYKMVHLAGSIVRE